MIEAAGMKLTERLLELYVKLDPVHALRAQDADYIDQRLVEVLHPIGAEVDVKRTMHGNLKVTVYSQTAGGEIPANAAELVFTELAKIAEEQER